MKPTYSLSPAEKIKCLQAYAAKEFGATVEAVIIPQKCFTISTARHAGMWLCSMLVIHPFLKAWPKIEMIAEQYARDRMAVTFGIRAIKDQMDVDPNFRRRMFKLYVDASNLLYPQFPMKMIHV